MPIISGGSGGGGPSSPGFEIGYDQITSPVNVASTTQATPTSIISCAAHTFDGAAVLLTVYFPYVENGSAAVASVFFNLFEGATNLGVMGELGLAAGTLQILTTAAALFRFTPTAGSHTYTISAWANSTTGTPQMGAGAGGTGNFMPAFARFTKV